VQLFLDWQRQLATGTRKLPKFRHDRALAWKHGNTQAAILTLASLRTTNAGDYQAIVTDITGLSATSAVATLTIIDPSSSTSLTLSPAGDTSIVSLGTNPRGVETILVGTRNDGVDDRGLLRFNLAPLPANATVVSADLRLTVTRVPRYAANSDFSLYRMLKAWSSDANWVEAAAGMPWSALGGLAGIDYASASSATTFVSADGVYDFGPSPALAADVQGWLLDPAANQGWLLKCESNDLGSARHFGSSESAQPPQLLVQYATPAPSPRLTHVGASGGSLVFQFESAAGWLYRVECRDDAAAGPWTTVTNVPAGPATTPIVISIPPTDGQSVGARRLRRFNVPTTHRYRTPNSERRW
jgi:hypothetical protein